MAPITTNMTTTALDETNLDYTNIYDGDYDGADGEDILLFYGGDENYASYSYENFSLAPFMNYPLSSNKADFANCSIRMLQRLLLHGAAMSPQETILSDDDTGGGAESMYSYSAMNESDVWEAFYSSYEKVQSRPLIREESLLWVFTSLYLIILVVGLIGNVGTIIVIHNVANLHSNTNFFLNLILGTATNVSIFTIVALSWDRFLAICSPYRVRGLCEKPRMLRYFGLIWVSGFAFSALLSAQFRVIVEPKFNLCGKLPPLNTYCSLEPDHYIKFSFEASLILLFFWPMALVAYFYIKLLKELRSCEYAAIDKDGSSCTSVSDPGERPLIRRFPPDLNGRARRAHAMVVRMLAVVVSVFFLCYLPYHIQRLITRNTCNTESSHRSQFCQYYLQLWWAVCGVLHFVSGAANPVLYNLMSRRFRVGFIFFFQRMWDQVTSGNQTK